jgi:hypothetical protein
MKHLVLLILELLFVSCQLSAQDIKGAYIRSSWVPNKITFTPIYEYSYTLTLLTDPLINVSRSTVTNWLRYLTWSGFLSSYKTIVLCLQNRLSN